MSKLQITHYISSMECALLKQLIFMGSFDEVSLVATIEYLTVEHIKEFFRSTVENMDDALDPS